jgi:hypothetical protein
MTQGHAMKTVRLPRCMGGRVFFTLDGRAFYFVEPSEALYVYE